MLESIREQFFKDDFVGAMKKWIIGEKSDFDDFLDMMSPEDNVKLIQKLIKSSYEFCDENKTKVARKLFSELLSCAHIDTVGQSDPMFVDFLTETAEFCVRAFKNIPP
jgi:hypothetical protein